jgi:hypothetical protein
MIPASDSVTVSPDRPGQDRLGPPAQQNLIYGAPAGAPRAVVPAWAVRHALRTIACLAGRSCADRAAQYRPSSRDLIHMPPRPPPAAQIACSHGRAACHRPISYPHDRAADPSSSRVGADQRFLFPLRDSDAQARRALLRYSGLGSNGGERLPIHRPIRAQGLLSLLSELVDGW